MWKEPRLSLVLLVGAALVCSITTSEVESGDHKEEGTRWRWPDEVPSRVGAGRLIPSNRRPAVQHQQGLQRVAPGQQNQFFPAPSPAPVSSVTRATESPTTAPDPAAVTETTTDIESSTSGKNASAVPLLKDAGKPGNPYILLNDIFPPQNSIRTKEEEDANLNSLQNKDLGGLDPSEVYLADDDLFVVRGFDYKKPYSADQPGPPINDYLAPSPQPPPPPEPGTVFYPSNETEKTFNFFNPNFGSTNVGDMPFFPFIPGGLNQNGPPPGSPEDPNFFPFPFLPPPPPHWTEEKEFNDNDIRDPFQSGGPIGNFPGSQGGPGQGFALFNGTTQGPPPPSGLNGFPGIPPQFQAGNPQVGPLGGQQRPPGFPPGGPAGNAPGGLGGFPPGGGPAGLPPTEPIGNVTTLDEDEDVPFTPLFPERPVEFYYPTHNTTAQPPGPFGPGIFVPPPLQFFAPRNSSEDLNITLSPSLFRPPFNLPNYYQKQTEPTVRPRPLYLRPQNQRPAMHYDTHNYNNQESQRVPGYRPIPSKVSNPTYPAQSPNYQAAPALSPNVPLVPTKGTILLDTQYKEVSQLPQIQQQQSFGPNYQQGHYHQPYHSLEPPTYGLKATSPVQPKPEVAQPIYNHHGPQYQQYPPYITQTAGIPPAGTISLESDINVNYRPQRPAINPDSEIIDPVRFHLNPTWNPYTASYAQPVQSQNYESPGQPTASGGSNNKPSPNFVTVYRIGGGSYSYNLNLAR